MRKNNQANTSVSTLETRFTTLTSKTGLTIPITFSTTVIGHGRSAKVYDAISHFHPNLQVVLRITKCALFPDNNILYAFEAVLALGQYVTGKELRHITLLRKGCDLEKHLRSIQAEQRSMKDIFRLSIAIARATYELHRHDIAHRDIKPANFILLPDHRVLMIDPDLAEPNIKLPSEQPKWGTHIYWRAGESKEEVDLWALLRTLYVPPQFECQQYNKQDSDEDCTLTTKLYSRSELQALPSDNYLCGAIPDSFFENNAHAKLKACLSTERLENPERFQTASQLLCGLILGRYDLFEMFNAIPIELEKLILAYQDRDPECRQLASAKVKEIIVKIAQSDKPEKTDLEKLNALFLSAPYASNSARFLRTSDAQAPTHENERHLPAKL